MNACFIHFHHVHSLLVGVGYVHHVLNHENVFFALPLIQRPRQPPSSPDCSDGTVSKAFDTIDHDALVWKSDNFLD